MRILRKPKVYLIARPQIVEEGLQEFLSEQGLDWPTPTEGVTDAERLVEISGRCCYMSFGKKAGSKTNQRYIQNLLGRNDDGTFKPGPAHGCYDEVTEVLTKRGWQNWEDVTLEDEFATRNIYGNIEYHKPYNLVSFNYKGKMYRVDSRGVDLLVTPNHNMLVCLTTTKEGRQKNIFELIKAENVNDRSHCYIKTGNYTAKNGLGQLSELIGFSIGDGYYNKQVLQFHLKKPRKVKYLYNLCQKLSLDITKSGDHYRIKIPLKHHVLFDNIYGGGYRYKQIPSELLFTNYATLRHLLDGLIESDGSKDHRNNSISFSTTSHKLAGQLQILCLHQGLACNIKLCKKGKGHFGDKQVYSLHILKDDLTIQNVNKHAKAKSKTGWVPKWEGKVYCAEVPNNTLYVRRNGKSVWCGNSVTEHPCWSFLVVGAGRGMSHEQVRHRVGWAYSQLSTRYCDFEREDEEGTWDPGFCIPPMAQLSEQTATAMAGMLEESRYQYIDLLSHIERDLQNNEQFMDKLKDLPEREAKRTLRKAARGAARDILPIATEAIMTMSANARAIWNCITLRANEHAEAVIRDIYVQIAKIMEKEMPALFNGLEYVKVWDGSEAVVMPREKL